MLKNTRIIDVFVPYANIEETYDQKGNISHFILYYHVECNNECKNEIESETHQDLLASISNLNDMLKFGSQNVSLLFQAVVLYSKKLYKIKFWFLV